MSLARGGRPTKATTMTTTMTTSTSTRLRTDVSLHATATGHVLLVGDVAHHVHLAPPHADDLLDALVDGRAPTSPDACRALDALVAAGLVDPAPPSVTVTGSGVLADAVRAALQRMGATDGGPEVSAHDDDSALTDLTGAPACWVSGHRVLLAPPAVTPYDVAARHRAATRHRDQDPLTAPTGRRVRARTPLTGPGLELAAVHVAAELLRPDRPAHEVVAVDLHALTVTRHPVLPVPAPPR